MSSLMTVRLGFGLFATVLVNVCFLLAFLNKHYLLEIDELLAVDKPLKNQSKVIYCFLGHQT